MLKRLKKINFNYSFLLLVLTIIISIKPSIAQEPRTSIGFQSKIDGNNYWWLEKNNFGINPYENYLEGDWSIEMSKFSISINALIQKNNLYTKESFMKYKISENIFFRLGYYYRDYSTYLNDNLSSGHMLISNNAPPMKKIGFVSSYHFKNRKNLTINYGMSHGVFKKNTTYIKAPMLHEKFIYLKKSKKNYDFGIGFIHEAMWGGKTTSNGEDTGSTLRDFLKVFISEDGPRIPGSSHANALGNHLGLWEFYYNIKNDDTIAKLYYQHFFEDTSGFRFQNKSDGLWGIELDNFIPRTTLLFEYMNTTNQDLTSNYLRDGYYNHSTYSLGWSHNDYIIGNPFINNLEIIPTAIFHTGIYVYTENKFYHQLLMSRRVNISDSIKYKATFGKKISNFDLNIFISNDLSNQSSFGIKLSLDL